MHPTNEVRAEAAVMMYSIVRVDGLHGSCGLCFRDVPAVACTEAVEYDGQHVGQFDKYRTTTLFTCRECSPGRAAVLFDALGLELFNGSLQRAA